MSDMDACASGWETLANRVYRVLVDQIRAGTLTSGTRLREKDIASSMGVSRTPVREAFARLQDRGLIQLGAGRMTVASLNRQQVLEIYALRARLEGAAAAFAAENAFPSEIAGLAQIATLFEQEMGDPAEPQRANALFHEAIYEAAHNRYLQRMLNDLNDSLALLPNTFLVSGRAEASGAEHKAVLTAIMKRDPRAAEAAARAHVDQALLARLKLLAAAEPVDPAGKSPHAGASRVHTYRAMPASALRKPRMSTSETIKMNVPEALLSSERS